MRSSRVRPRIATWTTAMVQEAPKRAAKAATRTAPVGTNRSQLQRTNSPSSKSRPTPQPTLISATKSSHQASPAVNHQAPDKAPSRHARTARAPSKAPSRHARTARAPSTPPSGVRPTSASNPTAASHSRMPQRERLTMCVSTARLLQVERQAITGREEVSSEERPIQAGFQVLKGQPRTERRRRRGRR